jgi:hypothetical protein
MSAPAYSGRIHAVKPLTGHAYFFAGSPGAG